MKTIDNDIKNGTIKKVYLLYGAENYLIRQYRDKLKKALVNDDDTMNFSEFEGEGIDSLQVIDLAETLPFFADRRLIVIEDSGLFKKDGETLAEYLPDAPDSTCFVFAEKEINKNSKLFKTVKKCGAAIEFASLDDRTLSMWIGGKVKKEGKGMTRAAYELFVQKAGTDMDNIDKELEKLLCYTMGRDMIEEADVLAITTEQIQDKIFEMVESISAHKQKRALDLYYDLLALKVAPVKILVLLSRQYEKLYNVRTYSRQGFNNKEIASKISSVDWIVKKLRKSADLYTVEQLKKAMADGIEYETQIKTGKINDQLAVELFIMQYSA